MELDRGNTLISEFGGGRVIEIDSAGSIVWEKAGLSGPMDAERLSNGNTLITVYGDERVIEVDNAGSIVWEKSGLSEPMDAERLSNDNTLISEFGGGRVIEIDNAGSIVWEKTGLSSPFDAERLSNGNTLIVEANVDNGRVIEVDSAGSIVWEKAGLSGPMDAERLSNGNTLITEHIGKKVIEVDSAGNEVWNITDLHVPKDAERLSNPPDAPKITGPTRVKVGVDYEYTFVSEDPDGDNVKYFIDWGDGDAEETGFHASGEEVIQNHTYVELGDYVLKAIAKDIWDSESEWSSFIIWWSKNQQASNMWFLRWLERFPILQKILDVLMLNIR